MEECRTSILKLAKEFEIESEKALKGNKAAAVRARKQSLQLGKMLKSFRKTTAPA